MEYRAKIIADDAGLHFIYPKPDLPTPRVYDVPWADVEVVVAEHMQLQSGSLRLLTFNMSYGSNDVKETCDGFQPLLDALPRYLNMNPDWRERWMAMPAGNKPLLVYQRDDELPEEFQGSCDVCGFKWEFDS